ncbi:MAG: hypothetical protein J1E96_07460 [Ruminococcus sp.]|nr:hypothetical protein [Ruminococcus sp.]
MNEKYYKAIDSLTPRDESVKKTIEAVTKASQSGKVIEMKTRKINKKFAAISAVAASLAVIITCGAFFYPGANLSENNLSPSTAAKQNGFFMTAYAAEATDDEAKSNKITSDDFVKIGKFVPTICFIMQENSEIDQMSGLFNFDLKCEGENIDKVTYKIENSTFCIKNNYKPVISRDDKSRLDKEEIIVGEEGEYSYYNSYTVNYDNQPDLSKYADDIKSPIQILGSINYKLKEGGEARTNTEWKNKISKSVLKDTTITVTATFNDGSTESQKLQLNCNRISDEEIVIEAKVID